MEYLIWNIFVLSVSLYLGNKGWALPIWKFSVLALLWGVVVVLMGYSMQLMGVF